METSSALPILPILPPLQTSTMLSQSDSLTIPTDKESTIFQSPSLSFAESFSTALSSPGEEREETSKLPISSLSPPQGLRKSISVDSFAQYSRDAMRGYPSESVGQSRNNAYGVHPEAIVGTAEQLLSSQNRGESLSSVHQDHDASSPPDSDVDRHDSHHDVSSTERFRRISLKAQDSLKSFVRGGDLPLPSRARNNSSTAAPSIITSLKDRGTLPSVSSMSSLQSPSAVRGTAYDVNAGRMRSGSLGYNPPSKRPVVNPHIPPPNRNSNPAQTIVLAVVGTTGCGKSTVIRKGLSQYGLTEATVISESSHPSRLPRYKRRTSSLTVELPGSPTSPVATPTVSNIDSIEVEIQTTANGTLQWPHGLPPIDGVIICYDLTDKRSYEPVEKLLMLYRATNLPVMVLGCKSDLEPEVESNDSLRMLKRYDTGLIEVSSVSEEGKEKMRQSFQYMLKAIVRQRGPTKSLDNRNPAAPPSLELKGIPTPWTDSETHLSLTKPPLTKPPISSTAVDLIESDTKHVTEPPDASTSPPSSKSQIWAQSKANLSIDSQIAATSQVVEPLTTPVEIGIPSTVPSQILDLLPVQKKKIMRGPRPAQWVDLEALLDKLLFLAVSGEEPNFITNFLLTYRRFCIPRQVLLAMQKRMRQLDMPCGDPMFASFAQMRICHLLETWIRNYPHDFSVKGTAGALHALMKSIISKTHLLHYGSELLPFLEQLPGLKDQDAAWAKKVDIVEVGSDESDGEEEEDETQFDDTDSFNQTMAPPPVSSKISFPPRERKSSAPMTKTSPIPPQLSHQSAYDQSPKQQIKELVKLANEVLNVDSTEIAQEITRTVARRFLMIQPRDWLNYTFVSGNRTENEPITAFNIMSNHLADWVVSLILCHERPRNRSRQIEKFVEIAQKLRQMNNYSALRAFVAGINNAMDDPTMEYFNAKAPEASKNLKSWDVLLQQVRSHRTYRLALRNSKGACIPALEVHMTDLIRAHEGNVDTNSEFPSKVHWGKYNMMGRFITTTRHCQAQCRNSTEYEFPERRAITELFFKRPVMTMEIQKSRLKSQDFDYDEPIPYTPPRDIGVLRKIFFW